nr:large proline-rich protein bag6-B-like isoform X1 [Ipomoea batatas]
MNLLLDVEDGHTLHLVVRQPTSESNLDPQGLGNAQGSLSGPGLFVGTLNLSEHGDGAFPDKILIVSAILCSIGIASLRSGNEGIDLNPPQYAWKSPAAHWVTKILQVADYRSGYGQTFVTPRQHHPRQPNYNRTFGHPSNPPSTNSGNVCELNPCRRFTGVQVEFSFQCARAPTSLAPPPPKSRP